MNYRVDIIVIGDSKDGNEMVKKIASSNPAIKMAFISREFKSTTTRDYLNVEYLKDEVILTDYKNRLFGCYLKNGDRVYGTHLIIATGLCYKPLMINNKHIPCVYNNVDDIPKAAKNQPAIVIGQQNSDVKFALAVAKKYKQVYLCTEKIAIDNITPANAEKLSSTENIVVLPNTTITKFTSKDGALQTVELSNYSTVTCSAIYVKTAARPEVDFVSDKLVSKENGYLKTTNIGQSSLVPKCFAVGNCAAKSTKKMKQLIIDVVLNDF
jgi:thioredoxin reductase